MKTAEFLKGSSKWSLPAPEPGIRSQQQPNRAIEDVTERVERGSAASAEAKKVRARKMIRELRGLGYSVVVADERQP